MKDSLYLTEVELVTFFLALDFGGMLVGIHVIIQSLLSS